MSKAFDDMLHIFGCVAQGKSVEVDDSVDFVENSGEKSSVKSTSAVILPD